MLGREADVVVLDVTVRGVDVDVPAEGWVARGLRGAAAESYVVPTGGRDCLCIDRVQLTGSGAGLLLGGSGGGVARESY